MSDPNSANPTNSQDRPPDRQRWIYARADFLVASIGYTPEGALNGAEGDFATGLWRTWRPADNPVPDKLAPPASAAIAIPAPTPQRSPGTAPPRVAPPPAAAPLSTEGEGRPRRERLEAPPSAQRNFPTVEMTGGELHRWIDEAEVFLVERDLDVYEFGDVVARIAPGPIVTADNRTAVALRIVRISNQHMVERFTAVAQFVIWDSRRGDWVAKTCPPSIAQAYLERAGLRHLRPLLGLASSPIFRRDGSILDTPGYDQASCVHFDPRGTVFPKVADAPTREDAVTALNFVVSLYDEVPFVDDASLSVALSANLCAVSRFAIRGMPLHGFNATAAGSGKSMACDIASIIATGSEAPALSIGSDPEELKKSLGAELSSGASVVNLDNCEFPVGGELINQVLTQERVKVRILGMSRMAEIPRGALIMANGNGLSIVGDLVRRSILATIDAKQEQPWLRTFKTENPVLRAKRERGHLVHALLTILRAHHVAGYPRHGKPPLGSFTDWDALIRGALIWCGRADPCDTMEHMRVADPRRSSLASVLYRWRAALGSEELTTGDVIRRAVDRVPGSPNEFMFPEFRESLLDVAGDGGAINSRRLGKWLSKNRGTVADTLRIEEGRFRDGYQYWRVVELGKSVD